MHASTQAQLSRATEQIATSTTHLLLMHKLVRLAEQRVEGLAGASLRAGVATDGECCNVDQPAGAARRERERLRPEVMHISRQTADVTLRAGVSYEQFESKLDGDMNRIARLSALSQEVRG